MRVIREFFLVIISVLLLLSLISMTLFWTLSSSLTYNNVEEQSMLVAKDFLQENIGITKDIQKISPIIKLYCQNNSDYVFSYRGYVIDIPCDVALQGQDAIIEEGIKSIIHKIYYTDYQCGFLNCFNEMYFDSKGKVTPLFLVSENAYNFWNNKFNISLIVSFILLISVFFLIEKKTTLPILIGSFLIISSLPFIKLDILLSLFSNKTSVKLLSIFFSQAYLVSIKILIAGIILLVIGIILKIFKVGFSISEFISKFRKKDEEQQAVKEKEKKRKVQLSKKPVKKQKRNNF